MHRVGCPKNYQVESDFQSRSRDQTFGNIKRHNTIIDGYRPLLREIQGLVALIVGSYNVLTAATSETNARQSVLGRVRIKDGMINLMLSPIVIISLVFFATMHLPQNFWSEGEGI
ncbi:MAG: hypothetical protein ACHQUC_03575 [Chlamydiales bacterium]